jgi:glutamine amidotransferase
MKQPIITIIDYGIGNTFSVMNAISFLGYRKVKISDQLNHITTSDVLILPGVGAFDACFHNLINRNLVPVLNEEVLVKKKPILGICVGMQLMATSSEENGLHKGLNWIPGKVKRLSLPQGFSIPHVGWNELFCANKNPLYELTPDHPNFYFDHSYYFECDESYVSSYCDYGIKVTASVQKDNIFGVQFHPEKSQTSGLKLFRSFFNAV